MKEDTLTVGFFLKKSPPNIIIFKIFFPEGLECHEEGCSRLANVQKQGKHLLWATIF